MPISRQWVTGNYINDLLSSHRVGILIKKLPALDKIKIGIQFRLKGQQMRMLVIAIP